MRCMLGVLISLVALGAQRSEESPFNMQAVFLNRTAMRGGCSVTNSQQFRNRAYRFRGWMPSEAPLVLRDGKALTLNQLGKPEWETELEQHSVVTVGAKAAAMLRFFGNHLGGSGSWGIVLIGTCSARQLDVVFEADIEGLTEVAIGTDEVLVLKYFVWSKADAHCCPSGKAEDHYRWDRPRGRFVRVATR